MKRLNKFIAVMKNVKFFFIIMKLKLSELKRNVLFTKIIY